MSFFLRYLKDHKWYLAFLFLCVAVFAAIFWLYGIPLGVIIYPASLCAGLGAVLLAADIYRKYRQHKVMFHLRALPDSILQDLEACQTLADEDYRELEAIVAEQKQESELFRTEELNYRFHDILGSRDDNAVADKMMDLVHCNIDRYVRRGFYESEEHRKRSIGEHEKIVAACRAGEYEKAAELLRAHILNAKDYIPAEIQ